MSTTTTSAASSAVFALSAPNPETCTSCLERPRHAGGRLSRCLPCIRASAELDRQDRIAAEALVAAREATKVCVACKKSKAVSDFSPHRTARDGRRRACRKCIAGGIITAKIQTPEQKARQRARAKKPERLASNLESVIRWQTLNPERRLAHKAVHHAVKTGKLVPPPTCQAMGCRRRKKLQAHHNSYSAKCRLKVSWLCNDHHKATHRGVSLKLKASATYRVAKAPKG